MKGKIFQAILLSLTIAFSCNLSHAKGLNIKNRVLAYFGDIKNWLQNNDEEQQFNLEEKNLLTNINNVKPGDFNSLVEAVFGVNINDLPRVSAEDYHKTAACMMKKCADVSSPIIIGSRKRERYAGLKGEAERVLTTYEEEDFVLFYVVKGDNDIEMVSLKNIRSKENEAKKWNIEIYTTDPDLKGIFVQHCPDYTSGFCVAKRIAYLIRGIPQDSSLYLDDRSLDARNKFAESWFKNGTKPRLATEEDIRTYSRSR